MLYETVRSHIFWALTQKQETYELIEPKKTWR
jgi:hypothetical protein